MSEEKSYPEDQRQKIEQEILQAIRGISYGSVEVLIHNAKISDSAQRETAL